MANLNAKTIATLVTLTSLCLGSTAYASDSFNKFPQQQPKAATKKAPKVTTYVLPTMSKSQGFVKKRRINRVVEPVTTGLAYVPTSDSSSMTTRFNKMVSQNDTTSREMPVLNERAVYKR